MRTSIYGLIALLLAGSHPSSAADADTGTTLALHGNTRGATACAGCHGADGAGNAAAGFPRLAGLDAGYLHKQLRDFQAGSRKNTVMEPIANALSDAEAQAVAAYYASRTSAVAAAPPATDAMQMIARGERIALHGQWENTIPACVSCHGPGGRGVGTHFPALAGQSARYIVAQFEAWRDGSRHNDPLELMKGIAQRLSEPDIAAVAAYFANLTPTPTGGTTKVVSDRGQGS